MLSVFKKSKKFVISTIGLCALIATGLFVYLRFPQPRQIPTMVSTPTTNTIHLRAVGDIMLGRSVATRMVKYHDWTWPFRQSIPNLPPVDSTIGNLETPILTHCPLTDSGMIFCAPKESIQGLVQSKFTVLSQANNHAYNHGTDGYQETKQLLDAVGIANIGNGEVTTQQINGETIAYIALDDVVVSLNLKDAATLITNASKTANLIIVIIHWGNEYQTIPSDRQREIANILVDNGADIILGAHPHVLQPIETQNNALIAYSLGNFIFDQMWSEETRKGMILDIDVTFDNHQLKSISYTPFRTTIYEYGQPRLDDNQ